MESKFWAEPRSGSARIVRKATTTAIVFRMARPLELGSGTARPSPGRVGDIVCATRRARQWLGLAVGCSVRLRAVRYEMLRSAIVLLGLSVPSVASAQGVGGVLRAGVGVDANGGSVLGGQVALIDFGQSSSVELAIHAFSASSADEYRTDPHDYHEDTRVRGVGLVGSVLVGHGPRESRGPYLALGLGLGPMDVDWRAESPTDRFLGTPNATGGSFGEEHRVLLGGLSTVGLGLRLHPRVDVRTQMLTLLAPPTDKR